MRFKGLLDPTVKGMIRVLQEHGGYYDGLWLPQVSAGAMPRLAPRARPTSFSA